MALSAKTMRRAGVGVGVCETMRVAGARLAMPDARSRQHDETRQFEEPLRILPAIEVVQVVVADDPVERRAGVFADAALRACRRVYDIPPRSSSIGET